MHMCSCVRVRSGCDTFLHEISAAHTSRVTEGTAKRSEGIHQHAHTSSQRKMAVRIPLCVSTHTRTHTRALAHFWITPEHTPRTHTYARTQAHTHARTHKHAHSLTHSLTRSLTHTHTRVSTAGVHAPCSSSVRPCADARICGGSCAASTPPSPCSWPHAGLHLRVTLLDLLQPLQVLRLLDSKRLRDPLEHRSGIALCTYRHEDSSGEQIFS